MDNVNHPQHYKKNGMEAIDVIEAFELNFCRANAVKYILRAGAKNDEVEDLKKAVWYLQREIEKWQPSTKSMERENSGKNSIDS